MCIRDSIKSCAINTVDNKIDVGPLDAQYPPKPSAQTDLNNNKILSYILLSVKIVPPKSIKWPVVCFFAINSRSLGPVIKTIGMNHMPTPKRKYLINKDLFLSEELNIFIKGKNTNGRYDSLIPAKKPDKKKPFSKCFPCL